MGRLRVSYIRSACMVIRTWQHYTLPRFLCLISMHQNITFAFVLRAVLLNSWAFLGCNAGNLNILTKWRTFTKNYMSERETEPNGFCQKRKSSCQIHVSKQHCAVFTISSREQINNFQMCLLVLCLLNKTECAYRFVTHNISLSVISTGFFQPIRGCVTSQYVSWQNVKTNQLKFSSQSIQRN